MGHSCLSLLLFVIVVHSPTEGTRCNVALHGPSNLCYPSLTPCENCQSATQKADFIPTYASLQSLQFLALTETWITAPLLLPSHPLSPSFTLPGHPAVVVVLVWISTSWKFSAFPLSNLSISTYWVPFCLNNPPYSPFYCCCLSSSRAPSFLDWHKWQKIQSLWFIYLLFLVLYSWKSVTPEKLIEIKSDLKMCTFSLKE